MTKSRSGKKKTTTQELRTRPVTSAEGSGRLRTALTLSEAVLGEIETLMEELDATGEFDVLLIGDGSGSKFGHSAGWACVSILRQSWEPRLWAGACNDGTNNLAELAAFLFPLGYFISQKRPAGEVLRIHIVTDSEVTARNGQQTTKGVCPAFGTSQGLWWRWIAEAREHGVLLTWHHRPRATLWLNSFADTVSKSARKGFASLELFHLDNDGKQA